MFGYVLALISSIFFGLYAVPRKLTKIDPVLFSFLMSLGFFVGSVLLYIAQPILKFHETINITLLWSLLAGVIWATSFTLFVGSIDKIGLSRANQWKNLQGPVGVILTLIVLSEYQTTNPFVAVLAGLAIFISAVFFSATLKDHDRKIKMSGIWFSVLAGIGFGTVTLFNKYVTTTVGIYSQQVVWSFGIAFSLYIYILLSKRQQDIAKITRKDLKLGLLAGFLYLGASFFILASYKYIDAAIGFTIVQLSSLWTIGIGIFLFKEIDAKKYQKEILLGVLFTIIGIVLLVFAKKI